MANREYIERLQMVIHQLHGADSTHVESVPVLETFRGQTVWHGLVEVFDLRNHPKAKRAYAWSTGPGDDEKFTAVLEVPPVEDALTTVRVSIVAVAKKGVKLLALSLIVALGIGCQTSKKFACPPVNPNTHTTPRGVTPLPSN